MNSWTSRFLTLGFCLLITCTALRGNSTSDAPPLNLSLSAAEAYALANHPEVQVGKLSAQAAAEDVRQARAALYPQVKAEANAVWAPANTQLSAQDNLSNPTIYSRQADGLMASQLLTDFGRTNNLSASTRFDAAAAEDQLSNIRVRVLENVDRAYFLYLRAQSMLVVAEQTVSARQLELDQVQALAQSQIKSDLDVSFTQQAVSQAKLFLLKSQSSLEEAGASLSAALGYPDRHSFVLSPVPLPPAPDDDPQRLIHAALSHRPDLFVLRDQIEAAHRLTLAQEGLRYPKISAQGALGVSPVHPAGKLQDTYVAAGLNVELPLLNGGRDAAIIDQARERERAAAARYQGLENSIARDVRITWLKTREGWNSLAVTGELVQNSSRTLELAQVRYHLGSISIVELTQAELNYTQAQLQDTAAQFDYRILHADLDFQVGSRP